MKNKIMIILFCSLAVGFSLLFKPSVSQGAEAMGGQVNTGGKIVFYDETPPSEEAVPPESSEEGTPPSEPVQKPAGRLPSTGEMLTGISLLTGLLFLLLLLFLLKRRKERTT